MSNSNAVKLDTSDNLRKAVRKLVSGHQTLQDKTTAAIWLAAKKPGVHLLEVVPSMPRDGRAHLPMEFAPTANFRYPLYLHLAREEDFEAAIRKFPSFAEDVAAGEPMPRETAASRRLQKLARCTALPMTVLAGIDDPEFEESIKKAYPKAWKSILHDMGVIRRQLRAEMQADCDSKIVSTWTKIEATRPSKDSKQVSYRYPFLDPGSGAETAPSDWKNWDSYQGNLIAVQDAVDEIIKRAGFQVAIAERGN